VEIKNDIVILQNPVTIFSKNFYTISIHNPSNAQVIIRIAEFQHHNLVLVACQELEVNQGMYIEQGETKEITVRYIP